MMDNNDTLYLRYWSPLGVAGPRERVAAAAAWIRKRQLEATGMRVVVNDRLGRAVAPAQLHGTAG